VVEARRLEVPAEPGRQLRAVTEHDPLEDRAPFSPEAGGDRAGKSRAEPVGEPAQPSARSDLRLPDGIATSRPDRTPQIRAARLEA
jgi:hypothetical protein